MGVLWVEIRVLEKGSLFIWSWLPMVSNIASTRWADQYAYALSRSISFWPKPIELLGLSQSNSSIHKNLSIFFPKVNRKWTLRRSDWLKNARAGAKIIVYFLNSIWLLCETRQTEQFDWFDPLVSRNSRQARHRLAWRFVQIEANFPSRVPTTTTRSKIQSPTISPQRLSIWKSLLIDY